MTSSHSMMCPSLPLAQLVSPHTPRKARRDPDHGVLLWTGDVCVYVCVCVLGASVCKASRCCHNYRWCREAERSPVEPVNTCASAQGTAELGAYQNTQTHTLKTDTCTHSNTHKHGMDLTLTQQMGRT